MKPEDIHDRDFMVGLRGYDKDEVRAFLAEIAADHAQLLDDLEMARITGVAAGVGGAQPTDDFESLGAGIAAVLRAAKESATDITADAARQTAAVREDAERYAANLRDQADAIRANAAEAAQSVRDAAADAAVELRGAAQAALDEAHEEVERILSDATAKAAALELESEARVRNRVEEAQRREAALRARLIEANEELQLALMALDGDQAGVDVRDERSSEVGRDVDRPEGSRFAPINDDIPAWS